MPRYCRLLPRLLPACCVLTALLAASACRDSQKNDTVNQLNSELEQLSRSVSQYVNTTEMPEEVKKLQQFEYQLVQLPVKSAAEEIQAKLNEMGKDRWECFYIEKSESGQITFYLKRRPDTPLKYVPKGFIGGG